MLFLRADVFLLAKNFQRQLRHIAEGELACPPFFSVNFRLKLVQQREKPLSVRIAANKCRKRKQLRRNERAKRLMRESGFLQQLRQSAASAGFKCGNLFRPARKRSSSVRNARIVFYVIRFGNAECFRHIRQKRGQRIKIRIVSVRAAFFNACRKVSNKGMQRGYSGIPRFGDNFFLHCKKTDEDSCIIGKRRAAFDNLGKMIFRKILQLAGFCKKLYSRIVTAFQDEGKGRIFDAAAAVGRTGGKVGADAVAGSCLPHKGGAVRIERLYVRSGK